MGRGTKELETTGLHQL